MNYEEFLETKARAVPCCGFSVEKDEMNPVLFEWQKDIVGWALKKGKAALFEDCGLGKTIQQLEWSRIVAAKTGEPCLILAPLAVSRQTKNEGMKFGYTVNICRTQDDVQAGINITNYEMLEHFDLSAFGGIVLDESSILKHYSSKMRNQIIDSCANVKYKLSCTATPAPNDYMELGNQSEFLGVMKRTEMLATFFVHDGGETSKWRLKGHAQNDFWQWLAGWAVVLTTPADLGYDGSGYKLPNLKVEYITVPSDLPIASTLSERRNARRASLEERCVQTSALIESEPNAQWLVWCDLNDEADRLENLISNAKELRGSDSSKVKENTLAGFSTGFCRRLITKPSIAGFGLNWQSCHNMVFVGLSDSYEMMYQAIRRCLRFGQRHTVNVYIVTSEAEGAVRENIQRKEVQCQTMIKEMISHTQEILAEDVRATFRMTEAYVPTISMIIPAWLTTEGATA